MEKRHRWRELNNDFSVGQYDLGGRLIAIHEGIRGASEASGVSYSGIWQCVFGRSSKSGGYKWARCNELGERVECRKR